MIDRPQRQEFEENNIHNAAQFYKWPLHRHDVFLKILPKFQSTLRRFQKHKMEFSITCRLRTLQVRPYCILLTYSTRVLYVSLFFVIVLNSETQFVAIAKTYMKYCLIRHNCVTDRFRFWLVSTTWSNRVLRVASFVWREMRRVTIFETLSRILFFVRTVWPENEYNTVINAQRFMNIFFV